MIKNQDFKNYKILINFNNIKIFTSIDVIDNLYFFININYFFFASIIYNNGS
jgi:hypothetical protein